MTNSHNRSFGGKNSERPYAQHHNHQKQPQQQQNVSNGNHTNMQGAKPHFEVTNSNNARKNNRGQRSAASNNQHFNNHNGYVTSTQSSPTNSVVGSVSPRFNAALTDVMNGGNGANKRHCRSGSNSSYFQAINAGGQHHPNNNNHTSRQQRSSPGGKSSVMTIHPTTIVTSSTVVNHHNINNNAKSFITTTAPISINSRSSCNAVTATVPQSSNSLSSYQQQQQHHHHHHHHHAIASSSSPPNISHFASSKCFDAPSPYALPRPPVHWTTCGAQLSAAAMHSDTNIDSFSHNLKVMLNVRA